MNYDLALIGHVLKARNIQEPIELGLTADLLDDDARIYWDWINAHHARFGEVPTLRLFQDHWPQYQHDPPTEALSALVHNIRSIRLAQGLDSLAKRVAETAFIDPWDSRRILSEGMQDLSLRYQENATDLVAGDNEHEMMILLDRLSATGGLMGHPWPWELLNRRTPGICPGNFIYIYGPEKSKKSWLMVYLVMFFEDFGLRVTVHSREMTNDEFSLRLYVMRAGLDYDTCIVQGKITSQGREALQQVMQGYKKRRRVLFTEVGEGITGVQAKFEQFKPNIIIHDYMKALADDAMEGQKVQAGKDHGFVAKAADHLASYAKAKGVPIIAVGHTNAEEAKLAGKSTQDAAHSKHIARRVDYMFRIVNDPYHNRIGLILVAGRSAQQFLGLTINGNLCNGFGDMIEENAEWVKDFDSVKGAEEKAKVNAPKPSGGPVSKISAASFAGAARKG